MARDGIMALRGLRQLAFSEQLTDTSGGTTYDTPILAEGPQVLGYTPIYATDELPGGDEIQDVYQKLTSMDITVNIAKMKLSLLAMLQGSSAVVSAGSTPNETATLTVKSTDQAPYVKIEGLVAYTGSDESGGGLLATILKAKLASGPAINHSQDGYANVTLTFKAIPRTYDSGLVTLAQYETKPTLSETPDVTAPTISSSSPADNDTGVVVTANLTVTFSEEIQFNSGDFTLVKASDDSVVAAAVTINGAGTIVTVNPTGSLTASTEHYLIVSANVKDKAGNAIAAATVISFTTA